MCHPGPLLYQTPTSQTALAAAAAASAAATIPATASRVAAAAIPAPMRLTHVCVCSQDVARPNSSTQFNSRWRWQRQQ